MIVLLGPGAAVDSNASLICDPKNSFATNFLPIPGVRMRMRRDSAEATHGASCDRARAWAALAPDGELSELERKLLSSHLYRCASCSSFSRQVAAVAAALRTVALEPLPQPVAIPAWRRRPMHARIRTVGAAAAVAVMALGIAVRAPLAPDERDTLPVQPVADLPAGDQAEARQLRKKRLAALAAQRAALNAPTLFFGNQPA